MENAIFIGGALMFIFTIYNWFKKRRKEPIVFEAALYLIGLALTWMSAKNMPIPPAFDFVMRGFLPLSRMIDQWLGG